MQESNKKLFVIISLSVITLTVIGITGVLLASKYHLINLPLINKTDKLSEADTLRINDALANISTLSLGGETLMSNNSGSSKELAYALDSHATYNYENYNYTYTQSTTETKFGSKINSCNGKKFPFIFEEKVDSFSYFNDDDPQNPVYMSKYVQYDKDGDIVSYYLSDGEYTYTYMGGSFAVREKMIPVEPFVDYALIERSDTTEDMSTETVNSDSESITSSDSVQPGGNPEVIVEDNGDESIEPYPSDVDTAIPPIEDTFDIVREENYKGQDTYVVKYTYTDYCSGDAYLLKLSSSLYLPEDDSDIVDYTVLMWLDKDDYNVLHEEAYLGLTIPTNLIYQRDYSYDNADKTYNEVESIFAFDINTGVKEFSYKDYPLYDSTKTLSKYFENNDILFIKPNDMFSSGSWVDTDYVSKYFNESEIYNPYQDRKFYPSDADGQKAYENMVGSSAIDCEQFLCSESYFGFNTENTGKSFYYDVYHGEVKSQVIEQFVDSNSQSTDDVYNEGNPKITLLEKDPISIQYGDISLSLDVYELTIDDTFGEPYVELHYFLEYNGYTYSISYFYANSDDTSFPTVEILNTESASDRTAILDFMQPMLSTWK